MDNFDENVAQQKDNNESFDQSMEQVNIIDMQNIDQSIKAKEQNTNLYNETNLRLPKQSPNKHDSVVYQSIGSFGNKKLARANSNYMKRSPKMQSE